MLAKIKERLFGKWELMGFGNLTLETVHRRTGEVCDNHEILVLFLQNSKTNKRKYKLKANDKVFSAWVKSKPFVDCELWKESGIVPDFYQDIVAAKLKR